MRLQGQCTLTFQKFPCEGQGQDGAETRGGKQNQGKGFPRAGESLGKCGWRTPKEGARPGSWCLLHVC